jgi:hypothetical protein
MQPWARLDVASNKRTLWQRIVAWFRKPDRVYVTAEIAHGVVAGAVEDNIPQARRRWSAGTWG